MRSSIKMIFLSLSLYLFALNKCWPQAGAGMRLSNVYDAYVDSIKNTDYKWVFPAWGKKLTKRGFDLQCPAGIMLNGYTGAQEITISDLQVGFNDIDPVPLDFIKFGEVKAQLQSVNARVDLWVLPFVDLYLIAGKTWTTTSVSVEQPFQFNTKANFSGNTLGLGTTLAGGYHGYVLIADINHTWTKFPEIKGTINTTLFTPRIGYNYVFKKKPWQNVVLWVGAPGVFLNRNTQGSIKLSELGNDSGAKHDLEAIKDETVQWYNELEPAQKIIVKKIAEAFLDKVNGWDTGDGTINYSLKKRPSSNWSMCVGMQFQLNHAWQFRTEFGFLGGRSSLLLSANYRFRW